MKDKLHLQSFENDDKTTNAHVYSPKANGGSRLRDRSSILLKQLTRSTASFCPAVSKKNDENGIALLFTLGILSLLLILAIAFATTSMTSRKMASNNSDRASARMLAHSALQKAIALLRYSAAYNYSLSDIVSHVENANENYYDFLWRMETQVEGFYYFDWPGYNDTKTYNPNQDDMPQWHYVDNGKTGNDRRIIGRYAYKVIDGGGKLDPNVTVRHSSDLGGAVNEATLKDAEVRNGMYQHEINIWNIDKNNDKGFLSDTIVGNMSSTSAGGKLPDGNRWVDFETMFTELGISDSNQKTFFKDCFILDNSKDPEAFWIDDNRNSVQDKGELYHRFNLARTDWDSLTVDNIIASPTKFDSSSTHNGTGILWLKNYSNLPVGTFSDAATRAKQIAANLKDYCDSDSRATTDNEDNPTYTGNDLTPYINEIGIQLTATAIVSSPSFPLYTFTYSINYAYIVELINIYGNQLTDQSASLQIEGKLTFTYTVPTAFPPNNTVTETRDINATISFTPSLSGGYSTSQWSDCTGTTTISIVTGSWWMSSTAQMKNVSADITKVKLTYGGAFADFARPGTSATIGTLVSQTGVGTANATGYLSYEANDPRQNLNTGDWESSGKKKSEGGGASYSGSQNAANTGVFTCTTEGDAEPGSTPTTISTAHIRNAPMRSPWELGAIHRGANWETLNIKYYNKNDAGGNGVYPDFGIGNYSDGDANILDQVKMTPDTQVYGKINLQEANQYVLAALLADIGIGCAFYSGNPGDSPPNKLDYTNDIVGSDIENPASDKIVGKILSARGDNATIKTRAQIALLVSELYGGTSSSYQTPSGISLNNDIKREEIIGKFINLTKGATMTDTVPIVVIAQSIKDTGSPNGMPMQKDLNFDGDTNDNVNDSNFRPFYGTSDTVSESNSSVKLGRYECGFDEITGECKILAFVNIDPVTKRPTILKLLYPDLE